MKVVIVTPPTVQLNTPYPSGAYLSSFFKGQGDSCVWKDLNIRLFYKIFSAQGLEKLFSLSQQKAQLLADKAEKQGDFATSFNLRRYVSTKQNWIDWIDFITAILCGNMREKSHEFLFSPFAPRGARMENFLSSLAHNPTVDDVRFLCSYALADLADYITTVFDPDFSLVRYAEHLTVDERSLSQIEKQLDSPVLANFYEQVLQENLTFDDSAQPDLICISIPFAGTFLPALYTARFIKNHCKSNVFVTFGGGFVNTQLRETSEKSFSKYIDAFSFDRGYGSYIELKNNFSKIKEASAKDSLIQPLYKLQLFFNDKTIPPLWSNEKISQIEDQLTAQTVPDFDCIDFSIYPRVCDDLNPMHRIWNDGAWIKAYLAHGCYWHKCAFCDTQLDYVCAYKPVQKDKLFDKLLQTAQKTKIYGIHFVDEALPPKALKEFALLNARNGKKLYFWGNVRFEKTFTKDLSAFLSFCGFGGASAGLEVATAEGLNTINKGTDILSVISACAAFKEAGILVHAYMIYGFWNDTPQSIINSMETLRQFFEAGLLDSAFWHKFVLTKNSQVFHEWKNGFHKDLFPIESQNKKSIFADTNLHFKGEENFNKYSEPLENALEAWMHGKNLHTKVQNWFDFKMPSPAIPRNFVEQNIQKYMENSSKISFEGNKDIFWIGSMPIVCQNKNSLTLKWFYLQEEFSQTFSMNKFSNFQTDFVQVLEELAPAATAEKHQQAVEQIKNSKLLQGELAKLHQKGLVIF